jgi:SET domain-containing protein
MLCVPCDLRPSPIHGFGIFLKTPVKKGDLIWRFDSRIDRVYTTPELKDMPAILKDFLKIYAYYYKQGDLWILAGDYGKFMNHDTENPTVLSGLGFTDEFAARDLPAGAELTSDYNSFCDFTRETGKFSPP